MLLVLEIINKNSRISATELEIVRITKRGLLVDLLFSLGLGWRLYTFHDVCSVISRHCAC